MLDFIFSLFRKPFQLSNTALITGLISDIVSVFESEYMNDRNAKNSAIDAVIKILEDHKDK